MAKDCSRSTKHVLQVDATTCITAMPDTSPAPVLILIHGATGNGRMWQAVMRHLDPRWNVLTPDLPGHGSRRDEPFTLDAAVATVAEVVRRVAPTPVVVGGESGP